MSKQRRVGALNKEGYGCVITEDIPELKKGQIIVKVKASVVSPGTEFIEARKARAGDVPEDGETYGFGYQNAGDVIEVGEGVTQFKPGDRVACMGAGYAQHTDIAVMPQNLCALLPDNVSYEAGAMAHLAMTALQAIRRGGTELGENLLVVGLGLVGQLSARLGQLAGMYVMGWDMSPFRCEVASKWGINATTVVGVDDVEAKTKEFTNDFGFDMAVMAIGGDGSKAFQSVKSAMKVSVDGHQMGRVCMVGAVSVTCGWGADLANLDIRSCARTGAGYHDDAWEHGEYAYPPCFMRWNTRSNMDYVLRLMSEGKLKVEDLITHRIPLEKIEEAVALHIDTPETTLGTVLLMDG